MGKYFHYYTDANAFTTDYKGPAYVEPWISYTNDPTAKPPIDQVDYNKRPDLEVTMNGSYGVINLKTANPCLGIYGEGAPMEGKITYAASGACINPNNAPETLSVKFADTGDIVIIDKRSSTSGSVMYGGASPSGLDIVLDWHYSENNTTGDLYFWVGRVG